MFLHRSQELAHGQGHSGSLGGISTVMAIARDGTNHLLLAPSVSKAAKSTSFACHFVKSAPSNTSCLSTPTAPAVSAPEPPVPKPGCKPEAVSATLCQQRLLRVHTCTDACLKSILVCLAHKSGLSVCAPTPSPHAHPLTTQAMGRRMRTAAAGSAWPPPPYKP